MKILFFGCQKIAIDILNIICSSSHELTGVITDDKNRDFIFSNESVSEFCFKNSIPSFKIPQNRLIGNYYELFKSKEPDIIFSIYYRRILPKKIIDLPRLGAINLHPSFLPYNRGPNPTLWNILNGDEIAGATLHYIDDGMDTGDIIAQKTYKIYPGFTGFKLNKAIMDLGVQLFKEKFDSIMNKQNKRIKQDDRLATCNVRFYNDLRYIKWNMSAKDIVNQIMALATPYDCAILKLKQKEFLVDYATIIHGAKRNDKGPGSFEKISDTVFKVQTHTTPIEITLKNDPHGFIPDKGRFEV